MAIIETLFTRVSKLYILDDEGENTVPLKESILGQIHLRKTRKRKEMEERRGRGRDTGRKREKRAEAGREGERSGRGKRRNGSKKKINSGSI